YGWVRPAGVPRRRWGIVLTLMTAGVVLLLVVLLNPTWVEPVTPPAGKPLLAVLVGASASLATGGAAEGRARDPGPARLGRACADELGRRFEVRTATFAEAASGVEAGELEARSPDGTVTDLAAALVSQLEDRAQGQALVLLSDGIHNAGG